MLETMRTAAEVVMGLCVGIMLIYIAARAVTLAYFNSRKDYETRIKQKTHTRQLEGVN